MTQLALEDPPTRTSRDQPGNPHWLRNLRLARTLNQSDIAAAIGVSTPMYSQYERRIYSPDDTTTANLATFYNIDELDLRRWYGLWTQPRNGNPADRLARLYTETELHTLVSLLIDNAGLFHVDPIPPLVHLLARRIWHSYPADAVTQLLATGMTPAAALTHLRQEVAIEVDDTLRQILNPAVVVNINRHAQ